MQEEIAENGYLTEDAKTLSLNTMAEIAQAVAQAIIEFLTELRKAAASAGLHASIEQEGAYLRQAVLDQIVNSQLAVMLALFMILMDKDAGPEEHDALESIVQKAITKHDQMSFVLDPSRFISIGRKSATRNPVVPVPVACSPSLSRRKQAEQSPCLGDRARQDPVDAPQQRYSLAAR